MTDFVRAGGRAADAMRPVTIQRGYTRHAEGSVLVSFGDTKVLCTASVEEKVPPHKRGSGEGWVTAEYGMLPRATHTRGDREAARGKQSGRTQEIQRLIGRSLRAVFDLKALGERTIHLDCDVLQADGGTRTAAITGAYVALADAVAHLRSTGALAGEPLTGSVAAVSVGMGAASPGPAVPVPVEEEIDARHATVDLGNPHLVIESSDPTAVDLATRGAWLEQQFDGGVNVEFVAKDGGRPDTIVMRVWERGAGITQACGTGACAAAHAAHTWGLVGERVTVEMPGGAAEVQLGPDIVLTGPAELVAHVEVPDG